MLEIFIASYLVITIPATILLLLAFITAQRANRRLHGADEMYSFQSREEKIHFTRPIPSVDV